MIGIEDKLECIRYFFYTDENGDVIEPNTKYQELMDFWDVYRGFDDEIPYEIKKNIWILQMIYEADSARVFWEKERRKREMSYEQIGSLKMICREFEEKIGEKELIILLVERTGLRVWERMKIKGFDGEGSSPERNFVENELMKLFQSGGIAVLVFGCKELTQQRNYGYCISSCGCERMSQKEIDGICKKVLQEESSMAVVRGRIKGNLGICFEKDIVTED